MPVWIFEEDGRTFVVEPWQQALLERVYRRHKGKIVTITTARQRHGRPQRRRLPHGRQRR